MNKGAGPTKERIAPDPTKRPVPMAPPRALKSRQHKLTTHGRIRSLQKLDVSTFQSTMSLAASARCLSKCRAMNKRLLIGSCLGVVIIRSIVALLRVSADHVVIGHIDR